MPVSLPSVRAGSDHRTVTLGELRELVAACEGQPDDLIVRANLVPFHMPDLGNPLGGRAMTLALDTDTEPAGPNRAQRRAAGERGKRGRP